MEFLNYILTNYEDLVDLFFKFRENDILGNPVVYDYGKYGIFSPTTLRYIKVAGDLRERFGDLSQMHIVEIGGGYGGQCKIISDMCGFASYTIIDLEGCIALAKKYLELLNVENVYFIKNTDIKNRQKYDLIISNYAFSEIHKREQEEYIKCIIKNSKNGYMIMNFIASFPTISMNELTTILQKNKMECQVDEEFPNTSPNNLLITWKTISE